MLSLYNLVIETTRRCNLECTHCLRGKRQNLNMNTFFMHQLFKEIDYISCVTFTGGEPTLPSGLKAIEYYINHGPETGSFYIVTNGKKRRAEFPSLVMKLWNFCDDNDISSIDISYDQYHGVENYQRHTFEAWLTETMLYEYGIELPMNRKEVYNVIMEGKAKEWGNREPKKEEIIWNYGYDDDKENIEVREGNIYLNCKGEVIAGCDWSYENQSDHIICTVEDDIQRAIMDYGTFDEDY